MDSEARALLACSVRGCASALRPGPSAWSCERGHSFDIASSGYVNLLQPQDRRSLEAGDGRETVSARRELLDADFGLALREAVLASFAELAPRPGQALVDLGCGEGHFLAAVCQRFLVRGFGVDLSAHAVERAARRHRAQTWIAANADRRLPFVDAGFDFALTIDGRRPRDELARILAPHGSLLVALPAADDLHELRAAVLGEARADDPVARLERELHPCFRLLSRRTARETRRLDRAGLARLALTTYRCARHSERLELERLVELEVTTSHEVLVLARVERS